MRNPGMRWQAIDVDRETMVLAGYHYSSAIEILHRMIGAMMSKFHFHRPRATGQPQQLMSHAYSENRNLIVQQFSSGGYGVIARFGVARTIGKKHAVGFQCQNLASGRTCG